MQQLGFTTLLLVFAGSALGGMCRYAFSGVVAKRWGEQFPFGTMAVNVSGAFVIGLLWRLGGEAADGSGGPQADFLILGFLGGYTTVSSFALNTLQLLRDQQWAPAAGNLFGSWVFCLAAVYAGAGLGGML